MVECQSGGQARVDLPPATAPDACYGAAIIVNDRTSNGEDASGPYSLGTTTVTYTATDGSGNSATCTSTVAVVDTVPPTLSVAIHPALLWPPNHRIVDVDASVTSSDVCGTPAVILTSVSSNEVDNGEGDGSTINDVQDAEVGTADFQFRLRAERAGGGSGRIYAAVYKATDGSGNEGSAAGFVLVPHDQGGQTDPIEISIEENGSGTTVRWNSVPGAESYNVIRGAVSSIRDAGPVINLGAVVCIENDCLDENTQGHEDAETPNPGEAFFYLVEYFDGTSSSYGTESAGKPRAAGPGDCP